MHRLALSLVRAALPALLLLPGVWSLAGETGSPSAEDAAARRAAALVEQALRRELARDAAGRAALVSEALRQAPDYLPARWHAGHVLVNGTWMTVEQAQRERAADPRYAELASLRQRIPDNLAGQLNLARWCRKQGLIDEAAVHWRAVLKLRPEHREALQALGVRLHEGRHLTEEEIARLEADKKQRAETAERWTRQVAAWRQALASGDASAKETALAEIAAVQEPAAVPYLEKEICGLSAEAGLAVVEALAGRSDPRVARVLARHAVISPFPEVREKATEALRRHPLEAFIPLLLSQLSAPVESWFRVVVDSDGSVYYKHETYREGRTQDRVTSTTHTVYQHDLRGPFRRVRSNASGGDVLVPRQPEEFAGGNRSKAVRAGQANSQFSQRAAATQQQAAQTNAVVEQRNRRITELLRAVTGNDFDSHPRQWWDWWAAENEFYVAEQRPVYEKQDNQITHRRYSFPYQGLSPFGRTTSCFAQGTPVWTRTGLTPIEKIQVGDYVLSQDPETGELAFKPVLQTTVRLPSPMREVTVAGEGVFATLGHPFWVNGEAWRMTKHLAPGQWLHGVHGPQPVDSVAERAEMPAHNLVVADFHSYFVGKAGVLVRDNSVPPPTTALVPGLHDATAAK